MLNAGVIADIALARGIGITPLLGGLAEQGDIEDVGLIGVGEICLIPGNGGRDDVRLNGVGMDAVVQLGQRAVEVPAQRRAAVFVFFKTLKFLDKVEFEFGA